MLGAGSADAELTLPPGKRAKRKNTSTSSGTGASIDPTRIEAYLQAACSALNFDIGEIWCCNDGGSAGLHFVQLYTSPAYGVYRSKLVTPSDDWENHHDVSKHRFSPQICEAVRDGGQIVWANTGTEEGLLGRSDLPLRTAVGAPVCCVGYELCILVLFSPCVLTSSPDAMEFLYTLAQAASEVMCGFLPASASEPVLPASADSHALSDHRKCQAIIDSLSQKSIQLQAWALGQIPSLAQHLRQSNAALSLSPDVLGLSLAGNRSSFSNLNLLHGDGLSNPASRPSTPISLSSDLFETLFSLSGTSHPMLASPVSNALTLMDRPNNMFGPAQPAPQQHVHQDQGGAAAGAEGVDAVTGLTIEEDDDFLIWSTIMDAVSPLDTSAAVGASSSGAMGAAAPASDNLPGFVPASAGMAGQASASALQPAQEQQLVPSDAGGLSSGTGSASLQQACLASHQQCQAQAQPDNSSCFFEDPLRRSRFEEFIRGLLGMSVFHAADCWLPSSEEQLFLACSSVQSPELTKWTSFSSAVVFPTGVAPAGRIYQQRIPMWFPEYSQVDAGMNPLAPIADILGIRTAFGVPIPVGGGKAGVVMFYSTSHLPTSNLMLSFVQKAFLVLLGDVPLALTASAVAETAASTATASNMATADPSALQQPQQHQNHHQQQQQPQQPQQMSALMLQRASNASGTAAAASAVPSAVAPFAAGITPGAASSLGRVAGAYDRHPQWQQMQQQQYQSHGFNVTPSGYGSLPAGLNLHAQLPPASAVSSSSAEGPSRQNDLDRVAAQQQFQQAALTHRLQHHSLAALHAQQPQHMARPNQARTGQQQVASFEVTSAPGGLVKDEIGFGGGSAGVVDGPAAGISASFGSELGMLHAAAQRVQGQADRAEADKCSMEGCRGQPLVDTQRPPAASARTKRTLLCAQHSSSKQCSAPGCEKTAQGSTLYCIGHGGGRRCTHPGCTKGARDRFFCAAHGGGKRCSHEGCSKAAVGGSQLCTAHGGGKRCNVEGCTKSAQSSTPFCVKHGGGRLCDKEGCGKVARGRTRFCAAHGGGVRCRIESCNRAAIGKLQLCRMHTQQQQQAQGRGSQPQSGGAGGVGMLSSSINLLL